MDILCECGHEANEHWLSLAYGGCDIEHCLCELTERQVYEAFIHRQQEKIKAAEGIILWALGENGNFPDLPDDWPKRKFYWRGEMRSKFDALAALASASKKGTE